MINLATAQKLKTAGLVWDPRPLDWFGIPERGMDEKIFVISDMLANIEMLQGFQVVAFQGASEWALDAIVTSEVVWVPREEQLRQAVVSGLLEFGSSALRLDTDLSGAHVSIALEGRGMSFEHQDAGEAYAALLLYLLERRAHKQAG
jgi:hypothetical protein